MPPTPEQKREERKLETAVNYQQSDFQVSPATPCVNDLFCCSPPSAATDAVGELNEIASRKLSPMSRGVRLRRAATRSQGTILLANACRARCPRKVLRSETQPMYPTLGAKFFKTLYATNKQ